MINDLPKIELHVHLDGSVDLNLASKILNEDIDKLKNKMVAKDKCQDLTDYLNMFDVPVKIMQTKENLENIAYNLTCDLEKDNVIYAEIRFAPLKHTSKLTLTEVLDSVLLGLNKNKNIKTRLILCMMRNDSFSDNVKIIDLAEEYKNRGVAGIDLAGDEINFKTSMFKDLFKIARDRGIKYTIHAGEAGSINSLIDAISFNPTRIGHGIKTILDDEVLKEVIKKDILLEVCPTSNYQTNAIDEYKNHPVYKMYNSGVKLMINTDNRTVSNITLNEEYNKLKDIFNFKCKDFVEMNLNAIKYSFLNDSEKKELYDKYNKIINGGV